MVFTVNVDYSLIKRRLREKYDKEIKDLENAEKDSKAKFMEVKTILLEREEEILGLKSNLKQLESQLTDYQQV